MPTTNPDAFMPVLAVRAGDIPARVLVVGDPARVDVVASRLDDARQLAHNREYVTAVGRHRGEEIGVVSHGVGSAGATICFEELCRSGVRRLIRAGTAGGMQPEVREGWLVVARGAVRNDGVTAELVPLGFPALADPDAVIALRAAAVNGGQRLVEGVVLTSGVFYPHDVLGSDLALWQRAGVVAVEMECAPLFVTATLHGVSAGAILAIDGNPLAEADEDMSGYQPHREIVTRTIDDMITVALDATARPLDEPGDRSA